MKKLFSLLIVLLTIVGAKAQQFDLQLRDSIVAPKGPLPAGGNVVRIGNTYDVYVWIKNGGTQSFDGTIALHAYTGPSASGLNQAQPQSNIVLDSLGELMYSIAPNQTIRVKKSLYIDNKNFKADSTVIVIIWPSGKAKKGSPMIVDINPTNNFAVPYLKLKSLAPIGGGGGGADVTAIQNIANDSKLQIFSAYPNPVEDILNVKFNTNESLTLSIRDLTGKIVKSLYIKGNMSENSIVLNLKNENLSNGFYVLSVTTAKGNHSESKFTLNR